MASTLTHKGSSLEEAPPRRLNLRLLDPGLEIYSASSFGLCSIIEPCRIVLQTAAARPYAQLGPVAGAVAVFLLASLARQYADCNVTRSKEDELTPHLGMKTNLSPNGYLRQKK